MMLHVAVCKLRIRVNDANHRHAQTHDGDAANGRRHGDGNAACAYEKRREQSCVPSQLFS